MQMEGGTARCRCWTAISQWTLCRDRLLRRSASASRFLSGLNRSGRKTICLSFDGDDFRAVEGPGLQNVEYTRSTVEATGENMQYEVGISTGTRTYLEVTGSGESRVRYERQGTVCRRD